MYLHSFRLASPQELRSPRCDIPHSDIIMLLQTSSSIMQRAVPHYRAHKPTINWVLRIFLQPTSVFDAAKPDKGKQRNIDKVLEEMQRFGQLTHLALVTHAIARAC